MTEQTHLPPARKRASSLKRQRRAVLAGLLAVALLVAVLVPVLLFTTRVRFLDHDGTKYYIRRRDGVYVMEDADGNTLPTVQGGNYETASGTIVMVDASSGDYTIIAAVATSGSEVLSFNAGNKDYDVLLYPMLERSRIRSIHVHNESDGAVNDYTLVARPDGYFEIAGSESAEVDATMLASLIAITGYTITQMRLDLSDPEKAFGFAAHGYAEYGLPERIEDAAVYYEIVTTEGVTHKVAVGNLTPPRTGRYARCDDRDDVYILREMEDTEQYRSLTTLLASPVESYVSSQILEPMSSNNYFDVTDFSLARAVLSAEGGTPEYRNIVSFSYSPIELRRHSYNASLPYTGTGLLDGFFVNNLNADDCLNSLMNLSPLRTVWVNRPDRPLDDMAFLNAYGVAYELAFTFNAKRGGSDQNYAASESYPQRIWISPLTENDTYYLYNAGGTREKMVVEVSRASLAFLGWDTYYWVESSFFAGNIGDCQEMEITSRRPTEAGKTGLTHARFAFDNSASGQDAQSNANYTNSEGLKVYADYDSTRGEEVNIDQFRRFYMTLLYSSLEGMANDGNDPVYLTEEQMAAYRSAGDAGADLVIRVTFDYGGGSAPLTFVYRFYQYSEGRSFITINGNGSFFILRTRMDKIVNDFGRIFDPSAAIDPQGKL